MHSFASGTIHLSDDDFVRLFESCELPGNSFHHADHIRLTWIYLRQSGETETVERMLKGIYRFACHNGRPEKFHYTVTRAWVRLVAAAWRSDSSMTQFTDFAAAHPHLLDKNALQLHYSSARLGSAAGREGWTEPDLAPLP